MVKSKIFLGIHFSTMTFRELLRELKQRLANSDLYPMTKFSVTELLKSIRLQETDKKIIFSSLVNDNWKYNDPLSLAVFWNNRINNPNLKFKF
jgi:hypothetical protein